MFFVLLGGIDLIFFVLLGGNDLIFFVLLGGVEQKARSQSKRRIGGKIRQGKTWFHIYLF